MKALSLLLLSLSIATVSVDALECYVCSSTTTNEVCNENTKSCQAPLDTCDIKAIVKQCASAATCNGAAASASVDSNGDGNKVTCCSTKLCNVSGASTNRLHIFLLALPLFALCFLRLIPV
ncbi:hypothetical protein JZ751_009559 [Albula glossodonta]|uniref:Snake toxin/toxin-like domain-containing protein n=1 Tax=Albula glossodonta TaxID=121402 RepID=A0A8T2NY30_9TELE|nr:hypothetical protein JZ751_009559 [Albula glossodonta]